MQPLLGPHCKADCKASNGPMIMVIMVYGRGLHHEEHFILVSNHASEPKHERALFSYISAKIDVRLLSATI